MAVQADSGGKDDLKTQFITREGTYRLMTLSEYSRPNRVGYTNTQGSSQVRVSLVTLPPSSPDADTAVSDDRICFNYGKELYVYVYKGVKKAADLTKPVDKKIYKGTNPTCHDFNTVTTTPDSVSLLIGFSTGQIQILDPIKKEVSKLYNEERLIDKSRVTCIRWAPGSSNLFLAAHASGQLYVYNEELGCGAAAPHYQPFKQGDGFAVHTCKTKSTRNPLYRWVVGAEGCCINEFAFSPCGAHLAVASQDGFLRVFRYDTMELVGRARSYFGGFLCVCWSPDGRYAVAGGEDDLVTVWSLDESRVAARGQGHRSWVSVVAFDPYARLSTEREPRLEGDAEPATSGGACYRLGSVSQDTQLCLWDITEDALRPPPKSRTSAHIPPDPGASSPNGAVGRPPVKCAKNNKIGSKPSETRVEAERVTGKPIKVEGAAADINAGGRSPPSETAPPASVASRLAGFPFGDRKENSHRRNFSLASKGNSNASEGKNSSISNSVALRVKSTLAGVSGGAGSTGGTGSRVVGDPLRLIGTSACPRFDDCPVLEPLVCKKVAHERLTALLFRRDCLVTACQDGGVYTWARPGLPPPPPPPRSLDASDLFERTDPPE